MPGTSGNLIDINTFVFEATFSNGKKNGIWCHSSFASMAAAQGYVDKLTPRLGKLPENMRDSLDHVIIHTGNSTAFAEDLGKFFVLYADNMDVRISNNDLEETVFHESTHVAFDIKHSNSAAWKLAQNSDVTFITDYAKSKPAKEDLAETNLFVYTMCKYPGRLAANIENWVMTNNLNRYNYITTNVFKNCLPTVIGDINNTNTNIVVYPNPASDKLIISQLQGICEIEILSITGKVMYVSQVNTSTYPVNISDYSKGVYIIRIKSEMENVTFKFIK